MNAANILTSVWPYSTAKHFAAAAGCSPRQAKRIITTGRVPAHLTRIFLRVADREIEKNRQGLEALQRELREIELQEMADRAAHRRAAALGSNASVDAGSVDATAQLALTLPENGEGR